MGLSYPDAFNYLSRKAVRRLNMSIELSNRESKLRQLGPRDELFDKNVDDASWTKGWENVKFTLAELAETVTQGVAVCAQLHGSRRVHNFAASDVAPVDVDDRISIEDGLAHRLGAPSANPSASNPRQRIARGETQALGSTTPALRLCSRQRRGL
jgi:hypothetical protein